MLLSVLAMAATATRLAAAAYATTCLVGVIITGLGFRVASSVIIASILRGSMVADAESGGGNLPSSKDSSAPVTCRR